MLPVLDDPYCLALPDGDAPRRDPRLLSTGHHTAIGSVVRQAVPDHTIDRSICSLGVRARRSWA
jgi:hypothetical protein